MTETPYNINQAVIDSLAVKLGALPMIPRERALLLGIIAVAGRTFEQVDQGAQPDPPVEAVTNRQPPPQAIVVIRDDQSGNMPEVPNDHSLTSVDGQTSLPSVALELKDAFDKGSNSRVRVVKVTPLPDA